MSTGPLSYHSLIFFVFYFSEFQDDVFGEKPYFSDHKGVRLFPALSVKEKETLLNFFEPIESENGDEDLFSYLLNSSDFDEEHEENLHNDSEQDNDSVDGENDKQFEFEESVDPPLYKSSATTLGFTVLMIITYAMRHHLTGLALTHLLLLICFILPEGHTLMRTLKEFKKYFMLLKTPVIYHGFCIKCYTAVPKQPQNTCDNPLCLADLSKASSKGYFLEVPIISQLSSMFLRKGFYSDIQHRFSRKKTNKESIHDIYDGNLYKRLFNSGQLSNPNNISFICNTDGVPLFKSSRFSLWPLYLAINEIPMKKRFLKENMILAGLWYGKTKPSMWSFLKPFYESLRDLEEVGVKFYSPDCGEFMCKSFLICGTFDLPARALVCNSTQFNGQFGCWKCLQPGGTVSTEKGGRVHAFQFSDYDKENVRTSQEVLRDAVNATLSGKVSNGVKGPSWLSFLKDFDIVNGIAIDYMHGVLLGVTKLLLTLLFTLEHSKEHFSTYSNVSILDKRLESIKPSFEISRMPRSLTGNLKHWKANEYRAFLLYYAGPCLYGLLPDHYFEHFMLLSSATYLLSKDGILPEDLEHAHQNLTKFCEHFSLLYSARYETLNVHQLLHLTDNVKNLGPLFTHSCFYFEDKNKTLLSLIHGTQNVQEQIVHAVAIIQNLPYLVDKHVKDDTPESLLYDEIFKTSAGMKIVKKLKDQVFAVGYTKTCVLDDSEYQALARFLGYAPVTNKVVSFERAYIKGQLFHSHEYSRVSVRNSYTVRFTDENQQDQFGAIKKYIQYTVPCNGLCLDKCKCNCTYNLALIWVLKCLNSGGHVTRVEQQEEITAVLIEHFLDLCLLVECDEKAYVYSLPNRLEKD